MSSDPRADSEHGGRWDEWAEAHPVTDAALSVVRWGIIVLGLCAVLITALGLVFGWQPAIVRTGSMEPAIPTGSVVLLRPVGASTVMVGDIVGAREGGKLILHRAVAVTPTGSDSATVDLVLKGDANKAADPVITTTRVFRPLLTLPAIAQPLTRLNGPMQQFFLGLLASGIVAVYVIRRALTNRRDRDRDEDAQMAALRAEMARVRAENQREDHEAGLQRDEPDRAGLDRAGLDRAGPRGERPLAASAANRAPDPAPRPVTSRADGLPRTASSPNEEVMPDRGWGRSRRTSSVVHTLPVPHLPPAAHGPAAPLAVALPHASPESGGLSLEEALAQAEAAAVAAAAASEPDPDLSYSSAGAFMPPGDSPFFGSSSFDEADPAFPDPESAYREADSLYPDSAYQGAAHQGPAFAARPQVPARPRVPARPLTAPVPEYPAASAQCSRAAHPSTVAAGPSPAAPPSSSSHSEALMSGSLAHAPIGASIVLPEPPVSLVPQPRRPVQEDSHDRHATGPDLRDPEAAGADPRQADRQLLEAIGVPQAWTQQLWGADRFGAVLRMLQLAPELVDVLDLRVVAVIGGAHAVQRESHRIAVDLQDGVQPRPVLRLPLQVPPGGGAPQVLVAMPNAGGGTTVVGIECPEGAEQLGCVAIPAVDADLVIAVVRARRPYRELMVALRGLDRPLAVAFDGPAQIQDVLPFLVAGLPVLRVDGVPLDRVALTALLCGYLNASSVQPVTAGTARPALAVAGRDALAQAAALAAGTPGPAAAAQAHRKADLIGAGSRGGTR